MSLGNRKKSRSARKEEEWARVDCSPATEVNEDEQGTITTTTIKSQGKSKSLSKSQSTSPSSTLPAHLVPYLKRHIEGNYGIKKNELVNTFLKRYAAKCKDISKVRVFKTIDAFCFAQQKVIPKGGQTVTWMWRECDDKSVAVQHNKAATRKVTLKHINNKGDALFFFKPLHGKLPLGTLSWHT